MESRPIFLVACSVVLLLVCSAAACWKRGAEAFELVNASGETLICAESDSLASSSCPTRTVYGSKLCLGGASCIQGSDLDRLAALLNAPPAPAPVLAQAQAYVPPAAQADQADQDASSHVDMYKPFKVYIVGGDAAVGEGPWDMYTDNYWLSMGRSKIRDVSFVRVDNTSATSLGFYGLADASVAGAQKLMVGHAWSKLVLNKHQHGQIRAPNWSTANGQFVNYLKFVPVDAASSTYTICLAYPDGKGNTFMMYNSADDNIVMTDVPKKATVWVLKNV